MKGAIKVKTLLSHLYSKIEGSPEDLATESLVYIISNSKQAKKIFTQYLYKLAGIHKPDFELLFKTQQVDENNTRPDINGVNEKNEEVILIESKYWAGLTENQPINYLHRLENSNYKNKKILVFICPDKRIRSLWNELIRKINNCSDFDVSLKKEINCMSISNNLIMLIVSWDKIINVIKQELISNNSALLLSDLNQLEGLCFKIDEEAFLPLKEQDLGIDIAKRIYGYYNLTDKIADELKSKLEAKTEGLKSSAFHGGYRKYMTINQWSVSLELNFKYWIEKTETPLWVGIKDKNWDYDSNIKEKLMSLQEVDAEQIFVGDYSFTYVPLFLPLRVSENIIINEIVSFLVMVFEKLG